MAVVTVKSAEITNRDATPRTPNNSRVQGGEVRHARAVNAIANGDSATSKYIYFSLPSNALVTTVRVTSPDIGTTTTGDIGLYDTTANGGAVVDADFFTAAFSLKDGAVKESPVTHDNVLTAANGEKTLWEALGLSADPQKDYDVVLTLVGAADAAGSVLIEANFTQ